MFWLRSEDGAETTEPAASTQTVEVASTVVTKVDRGHLRPPSQNGHATSSTQGLQYLQ